MIPDALEYAKNSAEIHVTGGTARKRRMVKKAARWMLGYTLGTRLAHNIKLNICLDDDLVNTRFYGSVIWEDDNHRPREYDMELCNHLKDRMLYRVLAHEMVHQYQWDVYRWDYFREYHRAMNTDSEGHGPSFFMWRERFEYYGLSLRRGHSQRRWFRYQELSRS